MGFLYIFLLIITFLNPTKIGIGFSCYLYCYKTSFQFKPSLIITYDVITIFTDSQFNYENKNFSPLTRTSNDGGYYYFFSYNYYFG